LFLRAFTLALVSRFVPMQKLLFDSK